jgi:hypothetical protein
VLTQFSNCVSDLEWAINKSLEVSSKSDDLFYTNLHVIATYLIKAILNHKYSPFEVSGEYKSKLKLFLNDFRDNFCNPTKVEEPILKLSVGTDGLKRISRWMRKAMAHNFSTKERFDSWDTSVFDDDIFSEPQEFTLDELVIGLMTESDPLLTILNPFMSYVSPFKGNEDDEDEDYERWAGGDSKNKISQNTIQYAGFEAMQNAMTKSMGDYIAYRQIRGKNDSEDNVEKRLLHLGAFGLCIANVACLEAAKHGLVEDVAETSPVIDYFPKVMKAIISPNNTNMSKTIRKTDKFKKSTAYDRSRKFTGFGQNKIAAERLKEKYESILKSNKKKTDDGSDPGWNFQSDDIPDPSRLLQHFSHYQNESMNKVGMEEIKHLLNPYSDKSDFSDKGNRKRKSSDPLERNRKRKSSDSPGKKTSKKRKSSSQGEEETSGLDRREDQATEDPNLSDDSSVVSAHAI